MHVKNADLGFILTKSYAIINLNVPSSKQQVSENEGNHAKPKKFKSKTVM